MSVEAACKQSVQFHGSEVRTASAPLVFKKTVFSKILIHHGDSQIPKFSTRYIFSPALDGKNSDYGTTDNVYLLIRYKIG